MEILVKLVYVVQVSHFIEFPDVLDFFRLLFIVRLVSISRNNNFGKPNRTSNICQATTSNMNGIEFAHMRYSHIRTAKIETESGNFYSSNQFYWISLPFHACIYISTNFVMSSTGDCLLNLECCTKSSC